MLLTLIWMHPIPPKRHPVIKILTLCGSLRRVSTNKTLLEALVRLTPNGQLQLGLPNHAVRLESSPRLTSEGIQILHYEGIGLLPFFNPDLEAQEPPIVTDFRARLKEADGLIISSPEYAHGVPGVLKNALDWLVGGSEITEKPTALLSASPGSTHAQESLEEILRTMSARLVPEASAAVNLRGKKWTAEDVLHDPEMAQTLTRSLEAFAKAIRD